MAGATKRPWLAATLSFLVTGLGHCYLRRWFRALAWLALAMFTAAVFMPEVGGFAEVSEISLWYLVPILMVVAMSVIDAYVLARQHNIRLETARHERCPACHREIDAEISFCSWCATELQPAHQPA